MILLDLFMVVVDLILSATSLFFNSNFIIWLSVNIILSTIWVLLYIKLVREATNISKLHKFIHIGVFIICDIPFVVMLFFILIWKTHGFGH